MQGFFFLLLEKSNKDLFSLRKKSGNVFSFPVMRSPEHASVCPPLPPSPALAAPQQLPPPHFTVWVGPATACLLETFSETHQPLHWALLRAPWGLGSVPYNLALDYITTYLTPPPFFFFFLWLSVTVVSTDMEWVF